VFLYNFTLLVFQTLTEFFFLTPINMFSLPSKLLEDAVNELSKLPWIGKKTALRLAMHLMI
jgi:hypothetical protein